MMVPDYSVEGRTDSASGLLESVGNRNSVSKPSLSLKKDLRIRSSIGLHVKAQL